MWIFLSGSFLSIVAYRPDMGPGARSASHKAPSTTEKLLVRARIKGDIERVFPDAEVERTPGRDYLYRALIDRQCVADAMAHQVTVIGYPNFKDSVKEKERHNAYMNVWSTMADYQEAARGKRKGS